MTDNTELASGKTGILLTATLVSSLIMLDSNIVAVSLPAMGRALGASFTDVQWIVSAYVLTYAALLMASGNWADLHGRRRAMIIGLVIFAAASVICGIAPSLSPSISPGQGKVSAGRCCSHLHWLSLPMILLVQTAIRLSRFGAPALGSHWRLGRSSAGQSRNIWDGGGFS